MDHRDCPWLPAALFGYAYINAIDHVPTAQGPQIVQVQASAAKNAKGPPKTEMAVNSTLAALFSRQVRARSSVFKSMTLKMVGQRHFRDKSLPGDSPRVAVEGEWQEGELGEQRCGCLALRGHGRLSLVVSKRSGGAVTCGKVGGAL